MHKEQRGKRRTRGRVGETVLCLMDKGLRDSRRSFSHAQADKSRTGRARRASYKQTRMRAALHARNAPMLAFRGCSASYSLPTLTYRIMCPRHACRYMPLGGEKIARIMPMGLAPHIVQTRCNL